MQFLFNFFYTYLFYSRSGNSPYYNTIAEFDHDYVDIYDALPNEDYEFTVSSVDKSEFVNSEKVNIHIPPSGK